MRGWGWACALALCVACNRAGGSGDVVPPPPPDAGGGGNDSGTSGSGADAGPDAGPDAGSDAGTGSADAGADAGAPESTGIKFGSPGPWPMQSVTYGSADGIQESPIVSASTDENENIWVATNSALYLMKPGDHSFHRFDERDGLHLPNNPVQYCDSNLAGGDRSCPIAGAADYPGINEIVGGGAPSVPKGTPAPYVGEVFVGYYGHHDWNLSSDVEGTWGDPWRHSGKLDRVRLKPDGTLEVIRFDMVSGNTAMYWHNRTVWKMVYDHFLHKHELYVGTDHGVDKFSPDLWKPTTPGTWFNDPQNNLLWMSDHLHPQTCYHHPCDASESDLRLGDFRGLALDLKGDLWVAGRWAAGLITWTADNSVWFNRGGGAYAQAFGDPYYAGCGGSRPVFCVPLEGDSVNLSAVTVTPDGKVWFSSGRIYADPEPNYGIASWEQNKGFTYYDPVRDLGLPELNVRDMLTLPDGRLVVASPDSGAVIWDPKTGKHTSLRAGAGLPDDRVTRLQLDTMVSPPALFISTWGGVAVLRQFP